MWGNKHADMISMTFFSHFYKCSVDKKQHFLIFSLVTAPDPIVVILLTPGVVKRPLAVLLTL